MGWCLAPKADGGEAGAREFDRVKSAPAGPTGSAISTVDAGDGPYRAASAPPEALETGGPVSQMDELTERQLATLQHMRLVVNFMDTGLTVPIVGYRFGADAVIGLVPYAGDWMGAIVGTYIMTRALKYNLPKRLVVRMAVNQAIDSCVGAIPVLGDLFDFRFKANRRNMKLIERHLTQPRGAKRADTCFLFSMFFLVVVVPFLSVLVIIGGIVIGILAATGKL